MWPTSSLSRSGHTLTWRFHFQLQISFVMHQIKIKIVLFNVNYFGPNITQLHEKSNAKPGFHTHRFDLKILMHPQLLPNRNLPSICVISQPICYNLSSQTSKVTGVDREALKKAWSQAKSPLSKILSNRYFIRKVQSSATSLQLESEIKVTNMTGVCSSFSCHKS